jgi:DNA-binding SARP family transcriptional activator
MLEGSPQVLLFGRLRFHRREGAATPVVTGAARDLLSYLCAHGGKELRRERVAELFWPELDETRSRAALNTAVWRINKTLRDEPGLFLRSTAESLTLLVEDTASIDVYLFEAAVRAAVEAWTRDSRLNPDVREALSRGIAHHTAPFLEGCNAEWAVCERERLFSLNLRGLGMLMQDRGVARDYEGALEYGSRILAADPFREQAQCEVMWLHVLNGQRAKALIQYRSYRALLAREMGIEPMAEMRALASHIENDPDAERRLLEACSGRLSESPLADVLQSVSRCRLETYRTLHTT